MSITSDESDFIRHALGLTSSKVGYRNFYRAGGDDAEIGRALVRKGMAIELPVTEYRPDPGFMITSAGFRAAARKGEVMDREETESMLRVDRHSQAAEINAKLNPDLYSETST